MSLTLGAQPGFTDLASSTWDSGNPISSSGLKSINDNAKFGAVRNEQFWGYYRNGETVTLPVSPADGYEYARNELVYSWSLFWTGQATGALNGTQSAPTRGSTSGGGNLLQAGGNVDQSSGLVFTQSSYFNGTQTDTNDGILLVITHAQRNR